MREEDEEVILMETRSGRKLAIIGTVFLLSFTLFSSLFIGVGFAGGVLFGVDVDPLPFLRLNLIVGWLLLFTGLLMLTEGLERGPIHVALLAEFSASTILYIVLFAGTETSLLHYLPFFIFVGILMPVLLFRLGIAFNSAISRIGGVFLFVSTILFSLTEYLPETLHSSQTVVSVISQSVAAITYVIVLLGFVLLKVPAGEQELYTREQKRRPLRHSWLGVASFMISVLVTIPTAYLLRRNLPFYPLRLSTIMFVFVPSALSLVGISLGIAGMGVSNQKTILSTLGVVFNGILLGITMSSALSIVAL
ncbi:MAG: hypothetical protein NT102_00100 [Caldiserica bacterium]|nr:hypothetical protein [Caldisericota bacterium]